MGRARLERTNFSVTISVRHLHLPKTSKKKTLKWGGGGVRGISISGVSSALDLLWVPGAVICSAGLQAGRIAAASGARKGTRLLQSPSRVDGGKHE